MKRQCDGVTLIELMVVVAIVAILAAVAYPSYRQYVIESARSEAHANLLRMVDMQERFFIQSNTYATTAKLAFTPSTSGGGSLYNYTVTANSNNAFTVQATPVAGSSQAGDTACAAMTITSAGVKAPAACW